MKKAQYIPIRTEEDDDNVCGEYKSWDGSSNIKHGKCYKKWHHVGRHKFRESNPREPLE